MKKDGVTLPVGPGMRTWEAQIPRNQVSRLVLFPINVVQTHSGKDRWPEDTLLVRLLSFPN